MQHIDLFETPKKIPNKVYKILNEYWDKYEDMASYKDTQNMLNKIEKLGYTFDYYLDNVPFGLRPIGIKLNQLKGYEWMN